MSRTAVSCLVALFVAASISACGRGQCEAGQTRSCYSGLRTTEGVGVCHAGVQTCGPDGAWLDDCPGEQVPGEEICDNLDDDCDGEVDEDVKNICGGCAILDGKPGDLCAGCGRLACKGTESLRCVPPPFNPGEVCEKEGCPGRYVCGATGDVVCQAGRKNGCGVCGGPDLPDLGAACQNRDGCDGTQACNATGTSLACNGPSKNSCGKCGLADVAGLGGACTGANGCPGGLVCTAAGDASECSAQPQNACGKCNGPAIAETIGDPCGQGECAGTFTCNATKDGTICDFPGRGSQCTGPDGCEGTVVCAADGATTACDAPTKNACDVCGGPALNGRPGDACSTGGCDGTLRCNLTGSALTCVPVSTCLPATDHVVISEVAGYGATTAASTDEFVELYNPTAADVALDGMGLWYRSSGGSLLSIIKFTSAHVIRSHGYFLVANSGFTGSTDAAMATSINVGMSSSNNLAIVLTSNATAPTGATSAAVIDAMGYGACTSAWREGTACAPTHGPGGSIERKARPTSDASSMSAGGTDENAGNGQDSQQNGADFVVRSVRDPQTSTVTEP